MILVPITQKVRSVLTALTWSAFSLACARGVVALREHPWLDLSLLSVLAVVFASLALGCLFGLWPTGRDYIIEWDGNEIVGIRSWWMEVEGCQLRQMRDSDLDIADHSWRAAAAAVDGRSATRWEVYEPGRVLWRRRFLSFLYNVGKDAPRILSPWGDVAPPVKGGYYLLDLNSLHCRKASGSSVGSTSK